MCSRTICLNYPNTGYFVPLYTTGNRPNGNLHLRKKSGNNLCLSRKDRFVNFHYFPLYAVRAELNSKKSNRNRLAFIAEDTLYVFSEIKVAACQQFFLLYTEPGLQISVYNVGCEGERLLVCRCGQTIKMVNPKEDFKKMSVVTME